MGPALLGATALLAAAQAAPEPRLTLTGEVRARYETLEGQFRAGGSGGDQILLFRTLVHGAARLGPVTAGLELQDSRAYLADSGTPLSTSLVNAFDVLQAYVRTPAPTPWRTGSLTLGRQTVSIGSKRQIERVNYANVIFSYTGAHYQAGAPDRALHVLAVVPVERLPASRSGLDDNAIVADREQWNRLIWAAHYRHRLADGVTWAEGFVYGLNERDSARAPTPDRRYVTLGTRFYRAPRPGMFDFDVEGALRTGHRRSTNRPDDTTDLEVTAAMAIAQIGYSFDMVWALRLAGEYYFASGDRNPDDGWFDQYERLFGARRTDLNNTSLHGPLTPANLSAPGLRLSGRPTDASDFWVRLSVPSLASATDSWVIARLRDPAGQSGRFLGYALDGQARWRPWGDRVELEAGASLLEFGGFVTSVPGGPDAQRTLFGYISGTYSF
jgi:hypothetical protein